MVCLSRQSLDRACRHGVRIAAFLSLGAMVTALVAWGCAIWSDRGAAIEDGVATLWVLKPGWAEDIFTPADRLHLDQLGKSAQFTCAYRRGFGIDRRAFIPAQAYDWTPTTNPGALLTAMPDAVQTRAGWPCLSFIAEQWLDSNSQSGQSYVFEGGYSIKVGNTPGGLPAQRIIPFRILWRGFLANTLLFAMALWLANEMRFIKRSVLARRNCCTDCGYPIGVSSICTECGISIDKTTRRTVLTPRLMVLFFALLPLGLVLSLALAVLCALYAPVLYSSDEMRRIEGPVWWTEVEKGKIANERLVGLGFTIDVFRAGSWGCNLVRGGWPMSALEHAVEYWESGSTTTRYERIHHGQALPRWLAPKSWDRGLLSTKANWPGIIINAVAWTAILWFIVLAARAFRRRPMPGSVRA